MPPGRCPGGKKHLSNGGFDDKIALIVREGSRTEKWGEAVKKQTDRPSDEPYVEPLQDHVEEEKPRYTPRPRWQLVMAWVLIGIMVLSVLNLCYWQIFLR